LFGCLFDVFVCLFVCSICLFVRFSFLGLVICSFFSCLFGCGFVC
jgi:hypothetical protein